MGVGGLGAPSQVELMCTCGLAPPRRLSEGDAFHKELDLLCAGVKEIHSMQNMTSCECRVSHWVSSPRLWEWGARWEAQLQTPRWVSRAAAPQTVPNCTLIPSSCWVVSYISLYWSTWGLKIKAANYWPIINLNYYFDICKQLKDISLIQYVYNKICITEKNVSQRTLYFYIT